MIEFREEQRVDDHTNRMAENISVRNKLPIKEENMWYREKFEKIYSIRFTKPTLDKWWRKITLNLIHTKNWN